MPSAVDITKATQVGRRRLRVRRTAIGIVAVIALTGVIAGSLITYGTRHRPPADAPTSFDPTVRRLTVSAAPDLAVETELLTRRAQLVFGTVARADGPPIHAAVMLNPAGAEVSDATGAAWQPDEAHRAAPVHGQRAYWSPRCRQGPSFCTDGYALLWEWAPDAWAGVYVSTASTTSLGPDLAVRIANATRTGMAEPVRMPIAAPVPAGTTLLEAQTVWQGTQLMQANLYFGYTDRKHSPFGTVVTPDDRYVSVSLYREPGTPAPPNTTVGGRPAHLSEAGITVYAISGDWAFGVAAANVTVAFADYAATVEVVAAPDDPTTWVSPTP